MDFGVHEQLILMGLLLAVAALLVAAPALHVPYPILLVLGGLALGFIPGVPTLQLPPELVLIAFLPPLLYSAAFFTSLRELRESIRPIGTLAIGLVLAKLSLQANFSVGCYCEDESRCHRSLLRRLLIERLDTGALIGSTGLMWDGPATAATSTSIA